MCISVALLLVACGADSKSAKDSTLARDLSLANQATAEPQLTDTALSAPAKKPAAPRTKAVTKEIVPAPPPQSPAALPVEATPAPPVAAPFRGILAGATFALTTKGAVCTTSLPGDKITATIAADVVGENGAVIPAGSTVVLEVAQVTPGDTPEAATIMLRIRSVIVNDQPVTVPSDVTVTSPLERHTMPRDKSADRKKVLGGVVAGAIVGQILGRNTKATVAGAVVGGAAGAAAAAASGTKYDACLPAGGTLRATTREAVSLTPGQ
jgi:hypothetical protein